jgi:large subunit ribosomal protein L10
MKVADWKVEEVDRLEGLLNEYPVVGVVDMKDIPARQLQKMRALLRGNVLIKMSKKSIMERSVEKASKKNISELKDYIKGQCAFVFSKIDPFKLYRILEKNSAPAPVKPNSIAPNDIYVRKGSTPFPPGPILAELQKAGIPTTISNGKIGIKEDKILVKKGEKVSPDIANALSRLGIEPVKIGLNLLAVYEKGRIFSPEVLGIDEKKVMQDLRKAYSGAVNISIGSGYITKETATIAITKAFANAKTLGICANAPEPSVLKEIISKANLQMLSIASLLRKEALDEELEMLTRR